MHRVELRKSGLHALATLPRGDGIKWRRSSRRHIKRLVVSVLFLKPFETGCGFLTRPVNHQMTCDGEQPGIEFGFAVVLAAALHHANPCFLKNVFCEFAIAGEEDEIAQEAMLVTLNQAVEQLRVT